MGVPNVVYKWKSLRTLYVSVFVMNVAGCVIVVIMIVSAVKLRLGTGQYLDLVVPGDGNFWPGMMLLIAFLCAPIYAIGIRLCFHLRFSAPDSIPRLNKVLFVHCALCFASVILVVGINAVGILRVADFHRVSRNGIVETMREYATDIASKTRVDMVQIYFRCCGSSSFKDWFHVRWVQKDGEGPGDRDEDRKNSTSFVSTDVPFSCCATEMLKPCIHHNILKSSEVYLYQPENRLTITTTGCHAKVLSHARYIGGLFVVGLILLATYQMVLGLLSRLLQTAHSNALYIGPKKGRYLAWVLGSMPKAETYDRLVYEGPAEELAPLRGPDAASGLPETDGAEDLGRGPQGPVKKVGRRAPRKRSSRMSIAAERRSSGTIGAQEVAKKSSSNGAEEKAQKNTSIPAPPPSPKIITDGETGADIEPRVKISREDRKGRAVDPGPKRGARASSSRLKELRESLERMEELQPPWKGGSPASLTPESASSRDDFGTRGPGPPPAPSSSTEDKKHKLCGKDSLEEDEIRMKKFCKDLSTEYKRSPYSKQRRDFSEEPHPPANNRPANTADDGLMIRSQIFAKFNPADAYSRFRGSAQDTMMRRSSQTHPQPPPIPISDQRTTTGWHDRCRPCQQFSENSQFISRPILFDQIPKPQAHAAPPSWPQRQKLAWAPRRQAAPTYFPVSSRPPRPPRLPPCLYATRDQLCQNVQSREVRGSQFVKNLEGVTRFQRCSGRHLPDLQPPRFSGC